MPFHDWFQELCFPCALQQTALLSNNLTPLNAIRDEHAAARTAGHPQVLFLDSFITLTFFKAANLTALWVFARGSTASLYLNDEEDWGETFSSDIQQPQSLYNVSTCMLNSHRSLTRAKVNILWHEINVRKKERVLCSIFFLLKLYLKKWPYNNYKMLIEKCLSFVLCSYQSSGKRTNWQVPGQQNRSTFKVDIWKIL